MKRYLSALLLLTLPAVALATPELKGSPQELERYLLDERRIIVIDGSGEEKVEADRVQVGLTVKTEESKLDDALKENQKLRSAIREKLVAAGIKSDDIKSSKFSSTPSYGWFKEKPKSYEISNEMKIAIHDESQLRAIARIVDEEKKVFLGATEFEDSRKTDNELKAREKSLAAISARKQLYEQQLKVKLAPMRVMDQRVYVQRPQRIQPMVKARAKESTGVAEMSIATDGLEGAAPQMADFGSITYSAHTAVEFIITP